MTLSHSDAFEPVLTTHLGALSLATPKLRQGSLLPSLLGRQGPLRPVYTRSISSSKSMP